MEIDLELLRQVFRTEADEHLCELEQALLELEGTPGDAEPLRRSFRAVHTIKGSAATVGLSDIAAFAHGVEDLLEQMRAGRLQVVRSLVTLLLESVDALRALAERREGETGDLDTHCAELGRRIQARLERPGSSEQTETAGGPAPRVESIRAAGGPLVGRTLRVGIEKLDRLLDLAGEIVIARSAFQEQLAGIPGRTGDRLREAFRESARLTLELQEQVSTVRMVSVGPTLRQFVRVARDLSLSLDKRVRLEIEGGEVEVDAAVIEHLKDPLNHMVRNAIDHGIETPDERERAGKSPCGLLVLRAFHRAGSIVIEAEDDGVGLDRHRILERASERGLVTPDARLSDAAVFSLLFEEGFSTAHEVTELSGRGVGMGVVRKNIESLGGSVRIHGAPGRGTTVALQLPLTLAVLEVLVIATRGDTFLLPLSSVVECFDLPEPERAKRRGWIARPSGPLSWVELESLLDRGAPEDPGATPAARQVVLVSHEGRHLGIAAGEIHGTQQIVIKPLSRMFRDLPGVAGCTILQSGRVALILDVKGLLDLALATEPTGRTGPAAARGARSGEVRA